MAGERGNQKRITVLVASLQPGRRRRGEGKHQLLIKEDSGVEIPRRGADGKETGVRGSRTDCLSSLSQLPPSLVIHRVADAIGLPCGQAPREGKAQCPISINHQPKFTQPSALHRMGLLAKQLAV